MDFTKSVVRPGLSMLEAPLSQELPHEPEIIDAARTRFLAELACHETPNIDQTVAFYAVETIAPPSVQSPHELAIWDAETDALAVRIDAQFQRIANPLSFGIHVGLAPRWEGAYGDMQAELIRGSQIVSFGGRIPGHIYRTPGKRSSPKCCNETSLVFSVEEPGNDARRGSFVNVNVPIKTMLERTVNKSDAIYDDTIDRMAAGESYFLEDYTTVKRILIQIAQPDLVRPYTVADIKRWQTSGILPVHVEKALSSHSPDMKVKHPVHTLYSLSDSEQEALVERATEFRINDRRSLRNHLYFALIEDCRQSSSPYQTLEALQTDLVDIDMAFMFERTEYLQGIVQKGVDDAVSDLMQRGINFTETLDDMEHRIAQIFEGLSFSNSMSYNAGLEAIDEDELKRLIEATMRRTLNKHIQQLTFGESILRELLEDFESDN